MTEYLTQEFTLDSSIYLAIGQSIVIKIAGTQANAWAKLALDAPKNVLILRQELVGTTRANNRLR